MPAATVAPLSVETQPTESAAATLADDDATTAGGPPVITEDGQVIMPGVDDGLAEAEEGLVMPMDGEGDEFLEYEELTWTEYFKYYIMMLLENAYFSGLMTLTTVYALYGEDLRLVAFSKSADIVFYSISTVAMFLFALELGLGTWAKRGFVFSFFWWLDLVATLSLIADIPWFMDPITAAMSSDDGDDVGGTGTAARAGRAARAGTRAGRIIRIVRIVRVLRLMRLVRAIKHALHIKSKHSHAHKTKSGGQSAPTDSPSQTGQKLSDAITRQTVIGVLLFILVFPFLNVNEVYGRLDYNANALEYAELNVLAGVSGGALDAVVAQLRDFYAAVRIDTYGVLLVDEGERLAQLRAREEVEVVRLRARDGRTVLEGLFDITGDVQAAGLYSIGFTTFIIFMLGVAAFMFNRVSNKYVIAPIESIMKMMREFSANPLDKMKASTQGAGKETSQLMQSITKIGALLQIGFGEAGARIIGENLKSGGELNAMTPGRKMVALFGFVVIFHFGDATEALKEQVMLFVNRVAAIVHACVHEHSGAINKNIGEAFLMVWPLAHRTEKRKKALSKRRSSVSSLEGGSRPGSPMKTPGKSPGRRRGFGSDAAQQAQAQSDAAAGTPPDRRGSAGATPPGSTGRFGSSDRRGSGGATTPPGATRCGSGSGAGSSGGAGSACPDGVHGGGAVAVRRGSGAEGVPNAEDLSRRLSDIKEKAPAAEARAESRGSVIDEKSVVTDVEGASSAAADKGDGPPSQVKTLTSFSAHRARLGSGGGTIGTLELPEGAPPHPSPPSLTTQQTDHDYSSLASSPPETPARVGVAIDSRVGTARTPPRERDKRRASIQSDGPTVIEVEKMYVLPEGTKMFTTADCAVAGFALCVLLIKASKQLQQLCQHERLQTLHPGFSVQTGYGLHLGWAIEGAIGSDLKIDASYLSPNVNLASRLEAASKQYHVRILVSEQVYNTMSKTVQACMRKIDCVTVKGSARPMVLYTLDVSEDEENVRAAERLDPTAIQEEEGEEGAGEEEGESTDDEDEEVDEELVEAEKEALEELEHERKMFERVDKIYKLKRTTTPEFMALWDSARDKYLAGEWGEAHALFVQCEQMLPDDGPTQTLKSYIERRDCVAPSSWKGVRELTSK